MVAEGSSAQDLFYRIQRMKIHIPGWLRRSNTKIFTSVQLAAALRRPPSQPIEGIDRCLLR